MSAMRVCSGEVAREAGAAEHSEVGVVLDAVRSLGADMRLRSAKRSPMSRSRKRFVGDDPKRLSGRTPGR